jgi:hypothetical protein
MCVSTNEPPPLLFIGLGHSRFETQLAVKHLGITLWTNRELPREGMRPADTSRFGRTACGPGWLPFLQVTDVWALG